MFWLTLTFNVCIQIYIICTLNFYNNNVTKNKNVFFEEITKIVVLFKLENIVPINLNKYLCYF